MLAVASLGFTSIASAQEVQSDKPIRVAGTIINVNFPGDAFGLRTARGTDIHIHVTGATVFRSPNGAVGTFTDLERGMKVIVIGQETGGGKIQAMTVGVSENPQNQTWIRLQGVIQNVSVGDSSFTFELDRGERVQLVVVDRTRFLGENGTIKGLSDLIAGMHAVVQAVRTDDKEQAIAAVVSVGTSQDNRGERFQVSGEIVSVNPGLDQFVIETNEGREVSFNTSDRTRFRSRDASITRLQDLKAGLFVQVDAVEREAELPLAVLIIVRQGSEGPGERQEVVRATGRVSTISASSFSIEIQNNGIKLFHVNDDTQFQSNDGSIHGIADLKRGRVVVVVAKEADNRLLAILVGIRNPPVRQEGQIQPERPSQNPDLSGYNNS